MLNSNNQKESGDSWRLVISTPASGAWNMAVDETLMESSVLHGESPTLRLFAWDPPCLSLGYAQKNQDVDETELEKRGWSLVRRPTGGRAILHTDEITYSVTGPLDYPLFKDSILESYHRIARALTRSLANLGVPATMNEMPSSREDHVDQEIVCFEVASNYEITFGGKKLIGSAQARRSGGFLQHGSLPLGGRLERITEVIKYPTTQVRDEAKVRLLNHAITLEQITHQPRSWEQAAEEFIRGFRESLNINFIPSQINPRELERANQLVAEKYGNDGWNRRI
jgi:lipoate-protein ligase A